MTMDPLFRRAAARGRPRGSAEVWAAAQGLEPPDRSPRSRRVLALALVAFVVLAGIGIAVVRLTNEQSTGFVDGSGDTTTSMLTTTLSTSAPETSEFCAALGAKDLLGQVPESYVGSAQHRTDTHSLVPLAPAEIRSQLVIYDDFLASGGIDPSDPDSNLVENFPPEVQAATRDLEAYIRTCATAP